MNDISTQKSKLFFFSLLMLISGSVAYFAVKAFGHSSIVFLENLVWQLPSKGWVSAFFGIAIALFAVGVVGVFFAYRGYKSAVLKKKIRDARAKIKNENKEETAEAFEQNPFMPSPAENVSIQGTCINLVKGKWPASLKDIFKSDPDVSSLEPFYKKEGVNLSEEVKGEDQPKESVDALSRDLYTSLTDERYILKGMGDDSGKEGKTIVQLYCELLDSEPAKKVFEKSLKVILGIHEPFKEVGKSKTGLIVFKGEKTGEHEIYLTPGQQKLQSKTLPFFEKVRRTKEDLKALALDTETVMEEMVKFINFLQEEKLPGTHMFFHIVPALAEKVAGQGPMLRPEG